MLSTGQAARAESLAVQSPAVQHSTRWSVLRVPSPDGPAHLALFVAARAMLGQVLL